MSFTNFNDLVSALKLKKEVISAAVVVAESKRTLEPVLTAYRDGFIEPILIGDFRSIEKCIDEIYGPANNLTIIQAGSQEEAAQTAVDLVNQGRAECIMKGRIETGTLMSVVLNRNNRMRTGGIVSALCIAEMASYHKLLAYTDGGITLFPDLQQKKMIIENAVEGLIRLGVVRPKVAVLAALEVVNPRIPATVDAHELKMMNLRGEIKNCIVEGPISYDLAVVKDASQAKAFNSPVAGDADLLVWPDINSGNIAGKALIHSARAKIAAYVVGTKVPIIISSRAATFEEKYLSLALAVCVKKNGA